jgi:hypothetical protein
MAAVAAVVAIVLSSQSRSGNNRAGTYRHELAAVFAPVVTANRSLAAALESLHGRGTSAASSAAAQAQQSVVAARGAMTVLATPAGSQELSQQSQEVLTDESGYLGAVVATLSSPSPGNVAQLQPLATNLQSAFVPLAEITAGGSTTASGTAALSAWASSRISAVARASAAANRSNQRKEVQQAATKAAQQAVADSGGSSSSAATGSNVASYGVQSLPDQCGYGVAGSSGVSCPFAENAFYEYWYATGGDPALGANISVWSAEGQGYYPLTCSSGYGVVDCTGTNASGAYIDASFTPAAVVAYTQSQAAAYAASGKLGPNG